MPVEKIVEKALQFNITTMALTDINNVSGIFDFVKNCRTANIKPIAGIDFRSSNKCLYIGIAQNNKGFYELNEFLSYYKLNNISLPDRPPQFHNAFIIYPFSNNMPELLYDNEFIGIKISDLNKLRLKTPKYNISKYIIYHPVTFSDIKEYEIHCNLRAVDNNCLLTHIKPADLAPIDEIFLSTDEISKYFSNFSEIIFNTNKLISSCSFEFDFKTSKNKKTFTGSKYEDKLLIRKLAYDGLLYRYGSNNKKAEERLDHELEIIDKLGFSAYFLIAWDIVRYSMSNGIYHVGRGSGANSLVAYCLKITDVDPIELNLYFERFINPKRTSPPDFDIDYSWKDRDKVQDYIFKRFGYKYTALLGAMSTFKDKSIFRELGKVHGLPKDEIDAFVENPYNTVNHNEITRKILSISQYIEDFPNLRSIHAGGIIISEEPVYYYTALDMPPKGFPTTQWDMYVAEDIGFEKIDILSQRGIGHINECVEIVAKNKGIKVDIHQVEIFKHDEKVKQRLRNGEAIGCFYIESPAMRGLLKKLRCDNYITLVAASSIIRPGVAKSGMMKEYIKRFHNPDGFKYLHPVMEEQLKETYGVMVYQEDVLKICHHFAGLDLADADVLRRVMSGKSRFKNELKSITNTFFNNCKARGYPDHITNEVWRQIVSFAGYSFSKAHSASYAVESFQSLYLKAHFPLEFIVAVINNFGGFYQSWLYFNEARRCGANINLPCVNESNYKTSIKQNDIYIGFIHISNIEEKTGKAIEHERNINGKFASLYDFINRVPVGLEQLIILIRAGAFRFTGKTKSRLLWDAHYFLGKANKKEIKPLTLFKMPEKKFEFPDIPQNPIDDAYDEIELLGFPVTLSYFDLLKTKFRGEIKAKDMLKFVGRKLRMLGLLVTIKYVWTIKKEIMNFATFIDDTGEFFDSVHFPDSLKQYPFKGYGIYLILGTITEEFGHPGITVEKMAKLPIVENPKYVSV
jgi:DNA polymerase-3 subunit alpha